MKVQHGTRQRIESACTAYVTVGGRRLLNFGGSGYLGLANCTPILEAGMEALRRYGPHAQLGRHYGFTLAANAEAEAEACRFFRVDGAMYFAAGYLFGLIALAGAAWHGDAIYLDSAAHYSLRDGALATGKPVRYFAHRDPADLERVLALTLKSGQRPVVATDGMFATYGSVAPLADYAHVIAPFKGWLVVDESHAFGTIGAKGRGAVEAAGLSREQVIAGGSMAKAFGAYGGIAIGSSEIIDCLWQTPVARGAALGMSAGAAMTSASLRYVRQHPELLARLRLNAHLLKEHLRALGLTIEANDGPLATFVHGQAVDMQRIQSSLFDAGIYITYSTYVGAGPQGALRIAALADHRQVDIERLVTVLEPLL